LILNSCYNAPEKKDRLAGSSRENKNGWIYVHLKVPARYWYQHGYLLQMILTQASRLFLICCSMIHIMIGNFTVALQEIFMAKA
jgi:hypothetical protein